MKRPLRINDDVPELLVNGPCSNMSMYTYDNGKVYVPMDCLPYGAGGNYGYQFLEKQNLMVNYDSDYAGLVVNTSYFRVNKKKELELIYILTSSYEDEEGNVISNADPEHYDENEEHYYISYIQDEDDNGKQITLGEYNRLLKDSEFVMMTGESTADEMLSYIESHFKNTVR